VTLSVARVRIISEAKTGKHVEGGAIYVTGGNITEFEWWKDDRNEVTAVGMDRILGQDLKTELPKEYARVICAQRTW
jgi:hypothetical protein